MSLFNWLGRRKEVSRTETPRTALDACQATGSGGRAVPSGLTSSRRSERAERRERLYAVVRESMTGAGMLPSSYKFKVLSLDSRGRQYLIMMDLSRRNVSDAARLTAIENHIAKAAKIQHDILVSAVYWRANEHLADKSLSPEDSIRTQPLPRRHEPLQAIAPVQVAEKHSGPGDVMKPWGRGLQQPAFADTEMDERQSPLSGTQFGELK
nr:hypothetical protein [uncultured Rhodoferax sp.]